MILIEEGGPWQFYITFRRLYNKKGWEALDNTIEVYLNKVNFLSQDEFLSLL